MSKRSANYPRNASYSPQQPSLSKGNHLSHHCTHPEPTRLQASAPPLSCATTQSPCTYSNLPITGVPDLHMQPTGKLDHTHSIMTPDRSHSTSVAHPLSATVSMAAYIVAPHSATQTSMTCSHSASHPWCLPTTTSSAPHAITNM